ncbi:TetR family transcriptional regulator [Kribbella pittospori]|uniref:TetR family transcriptional regulator n=1 Tax=Kribbella pittospori TaxID=722689 RepID=A0A4R0JDK8_9ACTN|nr:TetR family transcriptional regulator [Kribbella pittospori]TCC44831.1 TetR family transcriptional regulator [Kribbella pittospori]
MATKTEVAAAARALFADQGYVATTIAAIAEAADIPAQTIYSAFGNKAAILRSIAWEVAGTLDIDRAHEEALAQPDPRDGLRRAANIQRRQFEQMYDVIDVYQEAARTDPDIAHDLQTIAANRERAFRRHIDAIASHLAPGVSVDDGVAIYLTLVLPEVYRTLVIEHRWTTDSYENWLANALITQLLRSP